MRTPPTRHAAPPLRDHPPRDPRPRHPGSIAFFFVGPLLEAGIGPFVITGGFPPGDGVLDHPAAKTTGIILIAAGVARHRRVLRPLRPRRHRHPVPPRAAPTARRDRARTATCATRCTSRPPPSSSARGCSSPGRSCWRAPSSTCLALGFLVHRFEEPLLHQRFGDAWDEYARHVPGWVPRPTPWRAG